MKNQKQLACILLRMSEELEAIVADGLAGGKVSQYFEFDEHCEPITGIDAQVHRYLTSALEKVQDAWQEVC